MQMFKVRFYMFLFAIILIVCGCSKEKVSENTVKKDSVNVADGSDAVKIDGHFWMIKNLNVDKFRNGDLIPEAKTNEEWKKAGEEGTPAWCYYKNNPENGKEYGRLYNWYAVKDNRGLAPAGFHIPTETELEKLGSAVNDNSNALKAIGQGEYAGAGTNTSGFSALLAGCRSNDGGFSSLGSSTGFWSSTEDSTGTACIVYLGNIGSDVIFDSFSKGYGLGVRCLKD